MLILEAASTSSLAGGVSLSTTSVAVSGTFGAIVDFTNGEGVFDFCIYHDKDNIIAFIAAAQMPSCIVGSNSPS